MKAVVFAGPTLFGATPDAGRDIVVLPPAAQGDLYGAARKKVRAIGLIDGRFETVPSVWHKEILYALSRGIAVYGAASMGALRAAELAPFGMTGVGAIADAYRSGRIENDDAVAVLHAPAEEGFRPLSEALVDMRATLAAAASAGILSQRASGAIARIAADTFFKERNWPNILRRAGAAGVPEKLLTRFSRWLPEHRIEQKKLDALLMIAAIRRDLSRKSQPPRPNFSFNRTRFWQGMVEMKR